MNSGLLDQITMYDENHIRSFPAIRFAFRVHDMMLIFLDSIVILPVMIQVKWIRMLYKDFSDFTRDQERLISINGRKQSNALDYLEGLLMMNQGSPDNWRSSFFPTSEHARILSLVKKHDIIYCLEVAKNYDDLSHDSIHKVIHLHYYLLIFYI